MERKSLIIHAKDNVAVLLERAQSGDSICSGGEKITLQQDIEFGHKAALCDLKAGDPVYKYGEEIGYMLEDVPRGTFIHNHNLGCRRGKYFGKGNPAR